MTDPNQLFPPQAARPLSDPEQTAFARLGELLQTQPIHAPRSGIRQEVLQQIRRPSPASLVRRWSGILVLALITLSLLWATLQPGVELNWSVESGEVTSFRVYRVDAQAYDFTLVDEIQASPNISHYSVVDAVLLPGEDIEYIVEGINRSGTTVQQQITVGKGMPILLSQITLILSSLAIAWCGVYLIKINSHWLHARQLSLIS